MQVLVKPGLHVDVCAGAYVEIGDLLIHPLDRTRFASSFGAMGYNSSDTIINELERLKLEGIYGKHKAGLTKHLSRFTEMSAGAAFSVAIYIKDVKYRGDVPTEDGIAVYEAVDVYGFQHACDRVVYSDDRKAAKMEKGSMYVLEHVSCHACYNSDNLVIFSSASTFEKTLVYAGDTHKWECGYVAHIPGVTDCPVYSDMMGALERLLVWHFFCFA